MRQSRRRAEAVPYTHPSHRPYPSHARPMAARNRPVVTLAAARLQAHVFSNLYGHCQTKSRVEGVLRINNCALGLIIVNFVISEVVEGKNRFSTS